MKIRPQSDGGILWELDSGWWVSPSDPRYFVAPDGIIYDLVGWLLCPRAKKQTRLLSIQAVKIFTEDELRQYRKYHTLN